VYKRPLIVVRRSTERPEVLGTFAELIEPGPGIGDMASHWLEDLDRIHDQLADLPSPYGDASAPARAVDAITGVIDA
jgi:UDP-N-acetylglucosamine 2-epimerase (non-hydrolysing)